MHWQYTGHFCRESPGRRRVTKFREPEFVFFWPMFDMFLFRKIEEMLRLQLMTCFVVLYMCIVFYIIYTMIILYLLFTHLLLIYSFIHLLFYLDVCFMYGFLRRMPGMGSSRREGNWWHPAMPAASSPMRSSWQRGAAGRRWCWCHAAIRRPHGCLAKWDGLGCPTGPGKGGHGWKRGVSMHRDEMPSTRLESSVWRRMVMKFGKNLSTQTSPRWTWQLLHNQPRSHTKLNGTQIRPQTASARFSALIWWWILMNLEYLTSPSLWPLKA